jgi:hypothetical protein
MKKVMLLFFYLFFSIVFLMADIPQEEFIITDKCNNITFELGDHFSKALDTYPNITFKGEEAYSNITYKEYESNGVIFSISAYAENEKDAHILVMETTSSNFITKRGISVGSNKNDVIKAYGEPNRIRGNKIVFFNTEYDHMELIFGLDDFEIVGSIELIVGT